LRCSASRQAAKSARSNCTRCKQPIGKSVLRFGQTKTTVDSSMFGRTFWRHLTCITDANIRSVTERLVRLCIARSNKQAAVACRSLTGAGAAQESIEAAEGWSSLRKGEQALVLRVFAGDAAALAEAAQANAAAVEADDDARLAAAGKKMVKAAKKAKAAAAELGAAAAAGEAAATEPAEADSDGPPRKKAKKKLRLSA